MQAFIMAGGKGTRLLDITKNEIPKPMADLAGKPILLWQVEALKNAGIRDITMIIGYLGEKIREYFGDGSAFGVHVDYLEEKEALGTAGSFFYLRERMREEYVLLVFGDVFFDIDLDRMVEFHRKKEALATLFVHPNSHPYDSDLVEADDNGRVVGFDSKENVRDYWYENLVNAGLYILDRRVLERVRKPVKTDLEKDILREMIARKEAVYAYGSPEYVKDVGTVDRIRKAAEEIETGFAAARNLKEPQRAVFLDRDGTINVLRGFVHREEDFVLEANAVEAIRRINASGMLAVVVTNQPSVARGLCTEEDIRRIHRKLSTLLGKEGVFLDGLYYCPHHPHKGFPEENPLYKIPCLCRKPETGMVKEAADKLHIDMASSWIVGDSSSDMELGRRAGLKKALVLTGEGGKDGKYPVVPDLIGEDILEAVDKILEREEMKSLS